MNVNTNIVTAPTKVTIVVTVLLVMVILVIIAVGCLASWYYRHLRSSLEEELELDILPVQSAPAPPPPIRPPRPPMPVYFIYDHLSLYEYFPHRRSLVERSLERGTPF